MAEAAKGNRWRWEQIDLENALLHVRRMKNGKSGDAPTDRSGTAGLSSVTA